MNADKKSQNNLRELDDENLRLLIDENSSNAKRLTVPGRSLSTKTSADRIAITLPIQLLLF
jgi:hypothetical protein